MEGWSSTTELHPHFPNGKMVEGGGFEPPKAEPSDLQSDPFGRSGTPPELTIMKTPSETVKTLFFLLKKLLQQSSLAETGALDIL